MNERCGLLGRATNRVSRAFECRWNVRERSNAVDACMWRFLRGYAGAEAPAHELIGVTQCRLKPAPTWTSGPGLLREPRPTSGARARNSSR